MICVGCGDDKHVNYFTKFESGRYNDLCKRCDMGPTIRLGPVREGFNLDSFEMLVRKLSTRKWKRGILGRS